MQKTILHNVVVAVLVVISVSAFSQAKPTIMELLETIDTLLELNADGTARVAITQERSGEGVKVFESIYYRRDSDDAFLIVMTAPEAERGNGYLRTGDNFWMYRRNTRTFQHINRDESIAGTNSRGEDFESRKLTEMYRPAVDASGRELITTTKLGQMDVYRFELTATSDDVAYPKVIMWVRTADYLPLKTESYSLNGTLMQSSYFLNYTQIEDKYMWVKAMFVDEFELGNRTMVEIKSISLQPIDDAVFTRAYLENLSR